jgi:hypothetical protein
VFTVAVSASDYGAFGRVIETLCDGWTYQSSSLDPTQVEVSGNTVTFKLVGETSFTYTVQASGTAGECCIIGGILKDYLKNEYAVTGDSQVCVCPDNNPPVVDLIYPLDGEGMSGEVTLNASATADPAGSIVSVVFHHSDDGGSTWTEIGNGTASGIYYTCAWNTKTVDNGDYKVKAVAEDDLAGTGVGEDESDVSIDNGFCLTLDAGWNMVSIPKKINSSSSNAAPDVFNLVGGETCDYYNGCTEEWSSNWDVNVVPCCGYLVYKLASETICVDLDTGNGVPPSQQLCKGWNLVGHPDTSEMSIVNFLSVMLDDGDKVLQMWHRTSDGVWTGYPHWTLDTVTPGDGYWLLMNNDGMMYGTP